MRDTAAALRMAPFRRSPTDGWVGTLEYPGYRAGNVVARLDHLPEVDPHHLYFDLLLLDEGGRTRDNHSGPCPAIPRRLSLDDRSRFVRLVAELVRHAPDEGIGLNAVHPAVGIVRERGVAPEGLVAAAQLLDDASSERAVIDSLHDLLEVYLGEEEACRTLADVVAGLAHRKGAASLDAVEPPLPGPSSALDDRIEALNQRGLSAQITYLARTLGKARVRHFLRGVTDFDMVPRADMFGV